MRSRAREEIYKFGSIIQNFPPSPSRLEKCGPDGGLKILPSDCKERWSSRGAREEEEKHQYGVADILEDRAHVDPSLRQDCYIAGSDPRHLLAGDEKGTDTIPKVSRARKAFGIGSPAVSSNVTWQPQADQMSVSRDKNALVGEKGRTLVTTVTRSAGGVVIVERIQMQCLQHWVTSRAVRKDKYTSGHHRRVPVARTHAACN